jgi:glutamate synthase domain-containing protein 1
MRYQRELEGGCGVLGVISTTPIKGKYLFRPLVQMHNRGNGKGGGIAAMGLSPEEWGVDEDILYEDYMLTIAYLDPSVRDEVESEIYSVMNVDFSKRIETLEDYREIGLNVKPPEVLVYFCKPKKSALENFKLFHPELQDSELEDEFVFRNSIKLNKHYYSSDRRAFVLSHGKNMIVLKVVGYAEQVIKYYRLEDISAHVWIGHQRYPTRGRVWHPGGAHPFVGLNDALVHNGDLANYHSIATYLKERECEILFMTDTEVAALLFDMLTRVYKYPIEYAIEAMAPTCERDFCLLSPEKQRVYRAIQSIHARFSPDGPWFFIIAKNYPESGKMSLIGITDTSMLRPQVFALQRRKESIGIIASEKQAIDALLEEVQELGFDPIADAYWNARGGSYTDGGAFIYELTEQGLKITDKFGKDVIADTLPFDVKEPIDRDERAEIEYVLRSGDAYSAFELISQIIDFKEVRDILLKISEEGDEEKECVI